MAGPKIVPVTPKTISRNSVRAMMFCKAEGKRLAKNYPEILDEYKAGKSLSDLGKKYFRNSERSMSIAMNSVYYCLRALAEQGLIDKEELKKIGQEHMSIYGKIDGKKGGRITFERRIGCFGISKERRTEISRKVAKKMGEKYGKRNYQAGLGIASLTHEQLKANIDKNNLEKGIESYDSKVKKTPYGRITEKEYVIRLRENQGLNWKEIEEKVNSVFDNNRKPEAIRSSYNENWRTSFEGKEKKTPCGVINEKAYVNYLRDIKELEWDEIAKRANRVFRNNRCANLIKDSYGGKGWRPLFDGKKRKTPYGRMTEKEYTFYLKENANMLWKEITESVNTVFGNSRSQGSICGLYNGK